MNIGEFKKYSKGNGSYLRLAAKSVQRFPSFEANRSLGKLPSQKLGTIVLSNEKHVSHAVKSLPPVLVNKPIADDKRIR